MRIKTPLLVFSAFVLGLALGGVGALGISRIRDGRAMAARVRFADELMLLRCGQRAFEAYQKEPPEMGIVALQFHLSELERKTDWNGPTIYVQDINWWRALAHARISLLYSRIGKPEMSSNHVSTAVRFLEPGKVARVLPTNQDGLMRWVQDADKRNSWL